MVRTTRAAAAKANNEPLKSKISQLSSPPATPVTKDKKAAAKATPAIKTEVPATPKQLSTPASGRKRTRKAIKQEDQGDVNELPHNLAVLPTPDQDEVDEAPPKKRTRRSGAADEDPDIATKVEDIAESPEKKQTPKKKTTKYKLNPGISPYPNYERPTPEECHEVVRILEKLHGKVNIPKVVPPPSLEVAGCGEVPSVLDALIRTRLSANTTNKNSSTAFQGLVKAFGTLKEGVGKGSVDWDAVRRAPNHDVFKAIERGGLAKIKSKDIQAIIQIAYEENQERKAALKQASGDPAGAENEPESEKQEEIEKAEQNVISLDHLHLLSRDDAIRKMVEFPGIGLKTASCVALFCMGHASFAVDTHVS
jgi:endonuclease III